MTTVLAVVAIVLLLAAMIAGLCIAFWDMVS